MPHRDIKVSLEIFDTTAYRLEYWAKEFGIPKSELANQVITVGLNSMTMGFRETQPEMMKRQLEYINKVRWDNHLDHETAWWYANNPQVPLPKTIHKGISKHKKDGE